jgi:hypothetical protein
MGVKKTSKETPPRSAVSGAPFDRTVKTARPSL